MSAVQKVLNHADIVIKWGNLTLKILKLTLVFIISVETVEEVPFVSNKMRNVILHLQIHSAARADSNSVKKSGSATLMMDMASLFFSQLFFMYRSTTAKISLFVFYS